MSLEFEQRPSDSPYIERVWRSRSENIHQFTSIASSHWNLVTWKQCGRTFAAVQGPETRATTAPVPDDATFFGIRFKVGTYLPHLPVRELVDSSADLPDVTSRSLWLKGSTWDLPDYDNAEEFVRGLLRAGILVDDPIVGEVLASGLPDISRRSIQRRFVRATGLSHRTVRQIERARQAAIRLREGNPARETTEQLGYFDQPHLARSLTRFIGRTATQLGGHQPSDQLSLLYKTAPSS